MYLTAEPYVPCFYSRSWIVMSYFKINPVTQQCCCSAARLLWLAAFPSLLSLLQTGISKDSMHLHPVPLYLSICQSSLWGSSIQTSSVFHLGTAVESLQMQMLPERKRSNPGRTGAASKRVIVPRRLCLFSAVTWHHQHLEDLQSQQPYLQLRNVRHPRSGRKWRREESVIENIFFKKRTDNNLEA